MVLRLGWRHPRPNDFQGVDQRPLRDTLHNLQQFQTWPHVSLSRSTISVGAGVTTVIAWDGEPDDQYHLHVANSTDIQVPADFTSWLAIGGATASTNFGGGAGVRRLEWRTNAVVNVWRESSDYNGAGVRLSTPIFQPVVKGDLLSVQVVNASAGADNVAADVFLYFLPMA